MRSLKDIIKACGGAKEIETASGGAITQDAVYKWPGAGIPDRHWDVLIGLCQTTPDELYEANRMARGGSRTGARQQIAHDAPAAAVDPSRPAEACALQPGEAVRFPDASPGDLSSEAA